MIVKYFNFLPPIIVQYFKTFATIFRFLTKLGLKVSLSSFLFRYCECTLNLLNSIFTSFFGVISAFAKRYYFLILSKTTKGKNSGYIVPGVYKESNLNDLSSISFIISLNSQKLIGELSDSAPAISGRNLHES